MAWFKCWTRFFSFRNLLDLHQGQIGLLSGWGWCNGDVRAELALERTRPRDGEIPKCAIKRNKLSLTTSKDSGSADVTGESVTESSWGDDLALGCWPSCMLAKTWRSSVAIVWNTNITLIQLQVWAAAAATRWHTQAKFEFSRIANGLLRQNENYKPKRSARDLLQIERLTQCSKYVGGGGGSKDSHTIRSWVAGMIKMKKIPWQMHWM